MTIDEAIAHAKDVAKEKHRQANVYFKFNDDLGINNHLKNECIACAEEHEQLTEWLEELKAYKSLFDKTKTTNPMYELGYNMAIENVAIMLEKKLADTTFRTNIVNDVRMMKEGWEYVD